MAAEHLKVTTSQLDERLGDEQLRLVDVRTPDAYNGWPLAGERRGGHIDRARSMPAKWINYIDWPDILQTKGMGADDPVIIYGYESREIDAVASHFQRLGHHDVSVYYNFAKEWSADADLPMSKLPRYRHLVPPSWLAELLETGKAPEYENDKFVLCHGYYRDRRGYDEGHIPGAVPVDTNWLESTETWNLRSPEELTAAFERLGITHDSTVILYGRFSSPDNSHPFPGSSAGHLGSLRCAFIMLAAGVKDVRILNGGLQSWLDEQRPVTREDTIPTPVADFGAEVPDRSPLVVDTEQAKDILKSPDKNLVCVRSWPEYIGQVSGYHYIEPKGRIPGTVFADCGSDAYHMENYRNLDHTMREYQDIERQWEEVGIVPSKLNAFYCGTGWRGSEAFLAAWLMGWPRIALYDGGWFAWSNDPRNPYETGVPK